MKILVACEYSGRVRQALRKNGHEAWSCDLRLSEDDSQYHIQGDVRQLLSDGWDAMIAHPYCTFNTLAGIRWMYHPDDTHLPAYERRRHPNYPNRMDDFLEGVEFFNTLQNAPIPKIALENSQPHGLAMQHIGRYDQIVQPWMFGEPYTKGAALWLKGLPKLEPTKMVGKGEFITHKSGKTKPKWFADAFKLSPSERRKVRSKTFDGIAQAMAEQWAGNA